MHTCNICNNHYKSELAYQTHFKRNKKCILLRDDIDNFTLTCLYCNELKSTKHVLEMHILKCPTRMKILEEQNAKLVEENAKNAKLIAKLEKENIKLFEENKFLKERPDIYPITNETLNECFKNMINVFKKGQYRGQTITEIKNIHDEHLLEYLLKPLKILACDISRNKYKILHNNQIIVDWNLYTTKKIIKQFIRNNTDIHTELDEILKLKSNQPLRKVFIYHKQKVSYEDFCDYIASEFYSGEYVDEFFQSDRFKIAI